MASKVEWALRYAAAGFSVFPVPPGSKKSYKSAEHSDGRKWGATVDPDEIARDFARWPDAGVGVVTGPLSGIFVLDADTEEGHGVDGVGNLRAVEESLGKLPPTLSSKSPSGSVHRYYKYPTDGTRIPNSTSHVAPGVDVRGDGGMVLAPPTARGDDEYRWISWGRNVAEAPRWLLDLLKQEDATDSISLAEAASEPVSTSDLKLALAAIPNDDRTTWDEWNNVGMALWRSTQGSDEGLQLFDEWSKKWQSSEGKGYDAQYTAGRWQSYAGSPPSRIGAGTIFFMASQAKPDWREDKKREDLGDVTISDFSAYLPMHQYIYHPTRELWPSASINAHLPLTAVVDAEGKVRKDEDGKPILLKPAAWLDLYSSVQQMVWAPGEPMVVADKIMEEGGWIEKRGSRCFNLYRPPSPPPGTAGMALRWIKLVEQLYGGEAPHIIQYMAFKVQHPQEKINHALFMGGRQGIGKDTILEPLRVAVGAWNFAEASPSKLLGRFNRFVRSVVLRINEARDLGEVNRYQLYELLKTYAAAPPMVLRVDEKNIREYSVLNCCGLIITSNHMTDGLYVPADDRRIFAAWSEVDKEDFPENFWRDLWTWYYDGNGFGHVARYLRELDISRFNPKAPPAKTTAFWAMVETSRSPEEDELADLLDEMARRQNQPVDMRTGRPQGVPAVTLSQLVDVVAGWGSDHTQLYEFLTDRRQRRTIPHRMEQCGYVPVRNTTSRDGAWSLRGKRQIMYGRRDLNLRDQLQAVADLVRRIESSPADRA